MSLQAALNKYIKINLPDLIDHKKFYESFVTPKELPTIIEKASQGIGSDNLMSSHQRRLGYDKCKEATRELAKYEMEIKKAKSFEDIFVITEIVKSRIYKIGNLWSYDTALRIGFSKKVYPKEVYVQAGVTKGVRKLFKGHLPKGRSLSTKIFPSALGILKPYQIENFLCIYGKKKKKQL